MQGDNCKVTDGQMAGREKRSHFLEARYWLRDLLLSSLLAFIVIFFLYQPVQVEGTSMLPRLSHRERILINKFVYHLEPIQRSDVVVFWYPLDPSKSYIKRVVGLPGEWVSVEQGSVYVDGKPLPEPYLRDTPVDRQTYPSIYVPRDHYYVLGDHRGSSNDSRAWGTVDRKYIYGKAVFVYWPFSDLGPVD